MIKRKKPWIQQPQQPFKGNALNRVERHQHDEGRPDRRTLQVIGSRQYDCQIGGHNRVMPMRKDKQDIAGIASAEDSCIVRHFNRYFALLQYVEHDTFVDERGNRQQQPCSRILLRQQLRCIQHEIQAHRHIGRPTACH